MRCRLLIPLLRLSLALPGGKAVTAAVIRDSVAHPGFELGKPMAALFNASSIYPASRD